MGCVASKLEDEAEAVTICRERKRQLKLAVERRQVLAEAHCRYFHSLYGVASAIKLFVARHSSPTTPFLIEFSHEAASSSSSTSTPKPPQLTGFDDNSQQNPLFLQQRPTESSTHEETSAAFKSCIASSSTSSDSCDVECRERTEQEELEQQQKQQRQQEMHYGGYFYMQMPQPPLMPQFYNDNSLQGDHSGWDFFNPFYDTVRAEHIMSSYSNTRSSDDELRFVREQEGIPELEEEEEEEAARRERGWDEREREPEPERVETEQNVVVKNEGRGRIQELEETMIKTNNSDTGEQQQKGLNVIDSPERGRELLDALKDIQDHFVRAFDSGKDVSRMLEVSKVYLQSGLEDIKENSMKLMQQSITWHRSTSSKPSSCKSLVASSSKKSSTWSEFKNDLFNDYGGMESGSHSLTLERLYAWEKKLYEEVKAGDCTRKIYESKCMRLRNQDVKGYDEQAMDKTRAQVKDLYARILVAIRRAESISSRIEKLRDEELQPQIIELLKGLTHTWKVMMESHETQNKIILEVKSFACSTYGKFCNDSHRLATLQLEVEVQNWRACFLEYIAAQRSYINALNGWLTKFLIPEVEFYPRGRSSSTTYRANGPTLLVIFHDWLSLMEKLPDKAVSFALKSFSKDVRALWTQQGDEQQQKRKVESLAKDLDRKTLALQRMETRFLDSKLIEYKPEPNVEYHNDPLTDKRDQLDFLRKKLEIEKERHHKCMQETERITFNGIQTGFSLVFESLTEFANASLKMYNDLVTYRDNVSCIEDSQVNEDHGR